VGMLNLWGYRLAPIGMFMKAIAPEAMKNMRAAATPSAFHKSTRDRVVSEFVGP